METNAFAARLAAVGAEFEVELDALIGFLPASVQTGDKGNGRSETWVTQ